MLISDAYKHFVSHCLLFGKFNKNFSLHGAMRHLPLLAPTFASTGICPQFYSVCTIERFVSFVSNGTCVPLMSHTVTILSL